MEILKSKTFWIGAAMFVVGGLHAVRHNIPALAGISDDTWRAIMESLQVGGVGLLGIFLRMAVGDRK